MSHGFSLGGIYSWNRLWRIQQIENAFLVGIDNIPLCLIICLRPDIERVCFK